MNIRNLSWKLVMKSVSLIGLVSVVVFSFLSIDIGGVKKTYAQTVAPSQVSAHNTEGDCWVIISGKVYSITNYLSSHSGGAAAIVPYCGTDATQGFADKPHPASDINALAAYYIGDLAVDATPSPSPSPFPFSTPVPSPSLTAVPTPSPVVSPNPSPSPIITSVSKPTHKEDEDDEDIDDDDEDSDLNENENKITKNIIKQYDNENEEKEDED